MGSFSAARAVPNVGGMSGSISSSHPNGNPTSGSPTNGSPTNSSPTNGSPSAGALRAGDAAACASRGYEVQQLAARVAAIADQADAALARLSGVEMGTWESPAGRAYRTALSLQAAALRRSRTALQEASAVVLRHAQSVMLSAGRPG